MSVSAKEVNTLSATPKYIVPAYELCKALYQPKEAQVVYNAMSEQEKEKTDFIMALLNSRKELLERSSPDTLPRILRRKLVAENFSSTENVRQFLHYLGYSTEYLNVSISPTETSPYLMTDW